MTVTLTGTYALLVLAAALQDRSHARLAFVALVPFAVALASFEVALGTSDSQLLREAARSAPSVFFAVNAGLLLIGVLMAGAAALGVLRHQHASLAGIFLLGADALALWVSVRVAPASRPGPVLATATSVGLLAAFAGLAVRRFRGNRNAIEPRIQWPGFPDNRVLAIAFGLGGLAVTVGSRVSLTFLGLLVAALAEFDDRRRRGEARFPWLPVAVCVLAPVWWLMATIAGPVGLRLADLAAVPLSPRAEILVALPLALVVWACFGLWPAHRLFPGGLLTVLGAALWLRVAAPAFADGLDHWQPVLMALATLGVLGGAVMNRGASALNAMGFLALASATPGSGSWALLLIGAGLAVGRWRERPSPVHGPLQRMGWASSALVLPMTLTAGFRTQVTYTLLASVGFALALWRGVSEVDGAAASSDPKGGLAPL